MADNELKTMATSVSEGLDRTVELNSGTAMPWLGLGVYQIEDDAETASMVRSALEMGYRSVDTAAAYGNERGVGRGLAEAATPREQIFLTTKVWNDDIRSDRVEAAADESLERLGVEYVDLLLLHWPIERKIESSWEAMEKIARSGKARSVGVCNYLIEHLETLLAVAETRPAVNQIECHPYLQSRDLRRFCQKNRIQVEAWSPFMQGGPILRDSVIAEIADRLGKTPAQVILRWIVQSGVVTIPKTSKEKRLEENGSIFDFELENEDFERIEALERNERSGPDPRSFDF